MESLFYADDHARSDNSPCPPYSQGWIEAWIEYLNRDAKGAHRLRRRVARVYQAGRQRIRVAAYTRHGSYDGDYTVTLDSVDAFGWRACLAAARALREDHACGRYRQVRLSCTDARIEDLLESELGGGES